MEVCQQKTRSDFDHSFRKRRPISKSLSLKNIRGNFVHKSYEVAFCMLYPVFELPGGWGVEPP